MSIERPAGESSRTADLARFLQNWGEKNGRALLPGRRPAGTAGCLQRGMEETFFAAPEGRGRDISLNRISVSQRK